MEEKFARRRFLARSATVAMGVSAAALTSASAPDSVSAAISGDSRIKVGDGPFYDARTYGGIQEAIDASSGTGVVMLSGINEINQSLRPQRNTRLRGGGFSSNSRTGGPTILQAAKGFHAPLIEGGADGITDVTIEGIYLKGRVDAGSKGVHAEVAHDWTIRDCLFSNFGEQAIHIERGVVGTFQHIWVMNSVMVRGGRTGYIGAIDLGCTDAFLFQVNSTASIREHEGVGDGFIAAIVIRGANSFVTNCVGQTSQSGIVYAGGPSSFISRFTANRADLNFGPGFVVGGHSGEFASNLSYRNSRSADGVYPGFLVTGRMNLFVGNRVQGLVLDKVQQGNGFDDWSSGFYSSEDGNAYVSNRSRFIRGQLYNIQGDIPHGTAGLSGTDWQVGRGDVDIQSPGRGMILTSPNGGRFRVSVDDDGNLSSTPA